MSKSIDALNDLVLLAYVTPCRPGDSSELGKLVKRSKKYDLLKKLTSDDTIKQRLYK